MIIEEGLIAIGILALIAAIFLLRGKGKTSQPKQQVMQKPAVNKQVVDLAGPSVSPKAQTAPFPVPQVPFPVSAGNRQTIGFTEQNTQSTQFSFPISQVPFPGSGNVSGHGQVGGFVEPTIAANTPFSMPTADEQVASFAQPSQATDTLMQIAFPAPNPTVVPQTPSWEVHPKAQVELTQPSQAQVAVALNGQHTAKPDQDLSMERTQSSASSSVVPSSSLNAVSNVLPDSPSIERQLAELMADTWALQQQAVEIGRRLNYLSTCIQHSQTSTLGESGTNNKG